MKKTTDKRAGLDVVAVVVGINHWEDVTGLFVRSLVEHEPRVRVVVIDNLSEPPYPTLEGTQVIRSRARLGYGAALNLGMQATPGADWHICLNNDCLCRGPFYEMMETANPMVVYGNEPGPEPAMGVVWQRSAWLCISKKCREMVGLYDEAFDAGYEDIDYEQMAREKGFGLETLALPIEHLDKHTRFEELLYSQRYERCKALFFEKHEEFRGLAGRYLWNPAQNRDDGPSLPWHQVQERVYAAYDIDMRVWKREKPVGISGCVRVRNDEEFLAEAVESHLPYLEECVLVTQPSTDRTEAIAAELARKHPGKVRVVPYPVPPVFITERTWSAVPENSIWSFVYMSNWALAQCRYAWIAKFEADVICLSSFERIRERVLMAPDAIHYYGRVILNVAGLERDFVSVENPRNGGYDEAVFNNHPFWRFVKDERYEKIDMWGKAHSCMGWSALHMKRCKRDKIGWNNEHYLPFTPAGVAEALAAFNRAHAYPGPDNPMGEACLFEWQAVWQAAREEARR